MNRARSSRWHHSSVYFSFVSHSERTSEDNPQLLFQLVQFQKNRKNIAMSMDDLDAQLAELQAQLKTVVKSVSCLTDKEKEKSE